MTRLFFSTQPKIEIDSLFNGIVLRCPRKLRRWTSSEIPCFRGSCQIEVTRIGSRGLRQQDLGLLHAGIHEGESRESFGRTQLKQSVFYGHTGDVPSARCPPRTVEGKVWEFSIKAPKFCGATLSLARISPTWTALPRRLVTLSMARESSLTRGPQSQNWNHSESAGGVKKHLKQCMRRCL